MKQIIFLSKKNDQYATQAYHFAKQNFNILGVHFAKKEDKILEDILWYKPDYIISYLYPLIVPSWILTKAQIGAINYHPCPPKYPGLFGANFAIYNQDKEFGVTCHWMNPKIDSGPIIDVYTFPILPNDMLETMYERARQYNLIMYYNIMSLIINDLPLPNSAQKWGYKKTSLGKRLYTTVDFERLRKVNCYMDREEIKRRVRACDYPGKEGAYMDHGDYRWFPKSKTNSMSRSMVIGS